MSHLTQRSNMTITFHKFAEKIKVKNQVYAFKIPYKFKNHKTVFKIIRKGLGPIRLGSEMVWVRVVPEILGPSRLGSELSDIL